MYFYYPCGVLLVLVLETRVADGVEDADHIFNALAADASGYLLKRAKRAGLLAALADVQAGGSPMSSHVARKVVQCFQRAPAGTAATASLSQRERELLELAARGYVFKEVPESLGISVTTVGTHIRRIYEKFHVHSRAQAVAAYTQSVRSGEPWRFGLSRSPDGK